jgi:hypothetical protein
MAVIAVRKIIVNFAGEIPNPMKTKADNGILHDDDGHVNEVYCQTYIAGTTFHDVDDIWPKLAVGTRLALVRQPDNPYDSYAIAVALADDYNRDAPEEFDFRCILGYVPRTDNRELADLMDHGDEFTAEIAELNADAAPCRRIRINIVRHGGSHSPSTRLRAIRLTDDELLLMQQRLFEEGFIYQCWRLRDNKRRVALPIFEEKVVFIHRGRTESTLYLAVVNATDSDIYQFVDSFEADLKDGCAPFILLNCVGPVTVPTWALDFLKGEPIGEFYPGAYLSKAAQSTLTRIFAPRGSMD